MAAQVSTLSTDLPHDFPYQHQTFHYRAAWKGIVSRFLSCANSDVRFTELVRSVAGQPNRFYQEEALFNFFVNGLSVI